MKRVMVWLVLLGCTALTVAIAPSWSADEKGKPAPKHAPSPLPGVEPEMLSADYWIALHPDADEVVMTPDDIERFNEKVRNKKVVFTDRFGKRDPLERNYASKLAIGLHMNPVLPLELPDTMPGDSLRVWLRSNIDYLRSRDFYDTRNATYSEEMKQEIVDAIDIARVPDVITLRWGLVVKRADMRLFPTAAAGFSDTQWEMDYFQTTAIYIIEPAAIIYESADGDFYYVLTSIARGWVAADRIALAGKKEIRALVDDDRFLMATGNKVPVYGDPAFTRFVQYLWCSETLPLLKKSGDDSTVKLPYRKVDGSLGVSKGYVKPNADVHIGYLPFTKRNVLTQIFKLLHTRYGWADQFDKRDCSGTHRVVLRCFGIITGRWPNFVLLAPDHLTYIDPGLSEEEKIEQVSKIEGAITWCGTGGHLVFYLGKAGNGKLYFMHNGGWGYDEGDQHYFVNRVDINEAHHSWYNINSPSVFSTFRK